MTENEIRRVFYDHKDAVYNFALRLTGSVSVAEDLCQDCFVQLLRNPTSYDPARGSMRAFLLGITRNLAHRRWREEHPTEPLDEETLIVVPDLVSSSVADMIASAILMLPPLQREVVLLFEYEGFTLEEIATVVGANVGTVKARLRRARNRLRYTLAPLRNDTGKTLRRG